MIHRAFACVVAALLALPLLAGCGGSPDSDSGSSSAGAGSTAGGSQQGSGAETVKTASTDLGTVLVDDQGETLYLFEKDAGSKSTCAGGCAAAWPPVKTEGEPQAGGSAAAGMLGTSKRSDGTTQVTYAGHPLYRYAGDGAPGDTNGQGLDDFGAKWYALGSNGQAITSGGGGNSASSY
jgi:predicted lipoprotein with Yx(FWY)xxD motif